MLNPYEMKYLNSGESFAYSFTIQLSPNTNQPIRTSIGTIEVRWASSLGESGLVRSSECFCSPLGASTSIGMPTLSSNNANDVRLIRLTCKDIFETVIVGKLFQVTIEITNTLKQSLSLRLQSRSHSTAYLVSLSNDITKSHTEVVDNNQGGIFMTGLVSINLGLLAAGETIEKPLFLYPMSCGLQEMKDLVIEDSLSGKVYFAATLFKTMICESQNNKEISE